MIPSFTCCLTDRKVSNVANINKRIIWHKYLSKVSTFSLNDHRNVHQAWCDLFLWVHDCRCYQSGMVSLFSVRLLRLLSTDLLNTQFWRLFYFFIGHSVVALLGDALICSLCWTAHDVEADRFSLEATPCVLVCRIVCVSKDFIHSSNCSCAFTTDLIKVSLRCVGCDDDSVWSMPSLREIPLWNPPPPHTHTHTNTSSLERFL